MRRLTCLTIATAMLATGCAKTASDQAMRSGWSGYGNAQAVDQHNTPIANLGARSGEVVVSEGWIDEICPIKGCWMRIHGDNGNEVLVRFTDYAFFVPRNARGRRTVIHGIPQVRTLSVEQRRHLLEDAGASMEEIASVIEPKVETIFMADGVWIQGEGLDDPYAPPVQETCILDEEPETTPPAAEEPEATNTPAIGIDLLMEESDTSDAGGNDGE